MLFFLVKKILLIQYQKIFLKDFFHMFPSFELNISWNFNIISCKFWYIFSIYNICNSLLFPVFSFSLSYFKCFFW